MFTITQINSDSNRQRMRVEILPEVEVSFSRRHDEPHAFVVVIDSRGEFPKYLDKWADRVFVEHQDMVHYIAWVTEML